MDEFFYPLWLLFEDLQRLLEYVQPDDNHLQTYSHRSYELFIRACTEFETVCKHLMLAHGHTLPERPTIANYQSLCAPLNLQSFLVGLHFWMPRRKYLQPFRGWHEAEGRLGWYQAFGKVKHDRTVEFPQARLENVLLAISALYVLHFTRGGIRWFSPFGHGTYMVQKWDDGAVETFVPDQPLSIVEARGA